MAGPIATLVPSGSAEAQRAIAVLNRTIDAAAPSMKQFSVTLRDAAPEAKKVADVFKNTTTILKQLVPESERTVKGLDAINSRLKFQNSVMGAAIGGAIGTGVVHGVSGLASQASPNGMNSVDKASSLLSGTIGSLLLPGFVALGAVALTAADHVQGWIDKNLDTVIDTWTDAIESAVKAAQGFAENVQAFGKNVGIAMDVFKGIPQMRFDKFGNFQGVGPAPGKDKVGPFADMDANGLPVLPNFAAAPAGGGAAQAGAGGAAQNARAPNELLGEVAKNMRLIANDMQLAMGPGSHMADPVGMWKQIAMQISNSELDAKKMEMQQKAINLIQQIANRLEQRAGVAAGGPVINGRIRRGGP